jgi:hypothetical protein
MKTPRTLKSALENGFSIEKVYFHTPFYLQITVNKCDKSLNFYRLKSYCKRAFPVLFAKY